MTFLRSPTLRSRQRVCYGVTDKIKNVEPRINIPKYRENQPTIFNLEPKQKSFQIS